MTDTIAVEATALETFGAALGAAAGLSSADAAMLGESLLRAEARGVRSHGFVLLPGYLRRLRAHGADATAKPEVVVDAAAVAVVDGHNALGALVGRFGMREAIQRAQAFGIGMVVCRGSNHFGAAGDYAILAAQAGCIGIASTNVAAAMAPHGGIDALIGNNPVSIAAPVAHEPPFCIDIAVSQVARGKIRLHDREGQAIPLGWAMDASGEPTTDPKKAVEGLLAPVGAHKGSGLSIAFDLLCGVLSQAACGPQIGAKDDYPVPQSVGHAFIAIDVARFLPLETFTQRVAEMMERIRSSRHAKGVERIYTPGEIENDAEALARREGVTMPQKTWQGMLDEARILGVCAPAIVADAVPR